MREPKLDAHQRKELTKAAISVLKFWSVMESNLAAEPGLDLQTHARRFMLAIVHDPDVDLREVVAVIRMADRLSGQHTDLGWLGNALKDLAKEAAVKNTGVVQ